MKAIIVEDSRLARKELRELLASHADVVVEAEATNVEEAYDLIRRAHFDVMFLDINMPGKNGFDLLEMLDDIPLVIFTTAYDEYAVKSFEYNALDYLLKPIKPEALERALVKARKSFGQVETTQQIKPGRVFIRDGERCWLVDISEIFLIESEGNYSRIHFQGYKPLIYRSLNAVEERLDKSVFLRANRSQIINLSYVKSMKVGLGNSVSVILHNDLTVSISRRNVQKLKSLMSF